MLELGIAPRSGKPAGEIRLQTTLILALCEREQAASPPSPERGRAARAQSEDPRSSPGSRQPRAVAALADPLQSARPARVAWPVDRLARPCPPPLRGAWGRAGRRRPRNPLFQVFKNNFGIVARRYVYFGRDVEDLNREGPGAPILDIRGPKSLFPMSYFVFHKERSDAELGIEPGVEGEEVPTRKPWQRDQLGDAPSQVKQLKRPLKL